MRINSAYIFEYKGIKRKTQSNVWRNQMNEIYQRHNDIRIGDIKQF